MDDKVELIYKVLIALSAGVFGVAIAITAQHIKLIGMPRALILLALSVQVILSLGVFLGVMIGFRSGFLPEVIPNDDWSALTAAYLLSSIPHIAVATGITIYNKEINKWLKERYGDNTTMPSMEGALNKDVKKAYDESVKVEDLAPKEPEIKICETCGQEVCEHKND